MSHEAIGIVIIACCDVLGGICFDFMSIRHSCTEHLCSCGICPWGDADDTGEREPLLPEAQEPGPHPPMQAKNPGSAD